MTIFILKYLFLFITGALMGWGIEVVYRRYFGKAKNWINPGFLSGPFLPLYGFGVCLLYIVSDLSVAFFIKIILYCLVTTLIEYLTGLFFLKYYKIRLWDYTELKFNIQGLIAPLYSLFWTILSLVFYFILYPYFYNKIEFLYEHLEFSLFIGIIYGVILVDVVNSFNLIARMKKIIEITEESKEVIYFEQLKCEIKEKFEGLKGRARKPSFLLPFKGDYNLKNQVKEHFNRFKLD
ncbi:putative ABC transporter permease [Clostridium sp. DL1XJH146]